MKQLIITLGLIMLGLGIFRMMITGEGSMYQVTREMLLSAKEAYECTN